MKKFIIILVSLIMTFSLAACISAIEKPPKDGEIDFAVGFVDIADLLDGRYIRMYHKMIHSLEEWEEACNEHITQVYPIELIEKYDEEFFIENTLIICTIFTDATHIEMDKISVRRHEGNMLVVQSRNAARDAINWRGHTIVLEVKKSDLVGIIQLWITSTRILSEQNPPQTEKE